MNAVPNSAYEYQVGGSLPGNAPTYVMRQADTDLYEGLKAGKFCYVLNSRQMGKSSLRVRTMQRLQAEGIACVAIDITAIGTWNITPEQWYAGVIDSIVSSLNLYATFDLEEWWTKHNLLYFVNRFSKFVEEILLHSISQNIVIFVDEIDSVLSLPFNIDDFFAVIRDCYNQRATKPDYRRLTFALIGVATPSDLIQDKRRTPFNIGRAIELTGFQLEEAQPLALGLAKKVSNSQEVLREILAWTDGQPFLTQKVCQLVLRQGEIDSPQPLPPLTPPYQGGGQEGRKSQVAQWVENLVQQRIISNWEAQDQPEHLKTIRDRILFNEKRASRLLGLYQQVLTPPSPPRIKDSPYIPPLARGARGVRRGTGDGGVPADDSPEQMELRLSGLVVRQQGKLMVANRIYQEVFNPNWVEKELTNLRPYFESFNTWLASNCQDESRLLRGKALQDALVWAANKSLSDKDYQFLSASQELDKREIEKALEAEKKARELERLEAEINSKLEAHKRANPIVTEAMEKARLRILIAYRIMTLSFIGATAVGVMIALAVAQEVQFTLIMGIGVGNLQRNIQEGTRLELAGITILRQFESISPNTPNNSEKIELLFSAMQTGQELRDLVRDKSALERYPAISPIFTLQQILNNLEEQKPQLIGRHKEVTHLEFSPDGKLLVTSSKDGIVKTWDLQRNVQTQFKGHQAAILSISISPDGKNLATASADSTAKLWNLQGQLQAQFEGHQEEVAHVVFSPDGKLLVTNSTGGTTRVWNVQGKMLAQFNEPQYSVISVSFSPNGEFLETVSSNGIFKQWDLKGEKVSQSLHREFPKSVTSFSYSPNGRWFAMVVDDSTVRLEPWVGKQLINNLKGHRKRVTSVSFSSDGKLLVTASEEGTTRLWNLSRNSSWTPLAAFKIHHSRIESVSFSPDGKLLAIASKDGTVKLLRVEGLDELMARGCKQLKSYLGSHPEAREELKVCQKGDRTGMN